MPIRCNTASGLGKMRFSTRIISLYYYHYHCALGIYEASSDTILTMMNDLGIEKSVQKSIIKKIMDIAVRSTYYIFCRRNKTWTDPALLHV